MGSVPARFSPKKWRGHGFGGRPSHSGRPFLLVWLSRVPAYRTRLSFTG